MLNYYDEDLYESPKESETVIPYTESREKEAPADAKGFSKKDDKLMYFSRGGSRRATRNFRGQGSRRQKGHNKKFCVKGISLRLCSLDLETEEIFEAFS